MATAFMGYVLPFGQMSFWGATVITNEIADDHKKRFPRHVQHHTAKKSQLWSPLEIEN